MTTDRDCKHGQLARSCNVCELEAEVAQQAAEIERKDTLLRQALEANTCALKALDAIGDEMTVGERYTNAGQYLIDSLNPLRDSIAAIKQHLGEV